MTSSSSTGMMRFSHSWTRTAMVASWPYWAVWDTYFSYTMQQETSNNQQAWRQERWTRVYSILERTERMYTETYSWHYYVCKARATHNMYPHEILITWRRRGRDRGLGAAVQCWREGSRNRERCVNLQWLGPRAHTHTRTLMYSSLNRRTNRNNNPLLSELMLE